MTFSRPLHPHEYQPDERAERAILSSAEAYRLVGEARDMRAERDAALAEVGRLRGALEGASAALSSMHIHSNPSIKFERANHARLIVRAALAAAPAAASTEAEVVRLKATLAWERHQQGCIHCVSYSSRPLCSEGRVLRAAVVDAYSDDQEAADDA